MRKILLASSVATLLLAGCNGDTNPIRTPVLPDTAEGLWDGVFSISTDPVANTRTFHALVTPDDQLWLAYTQASAGALAGIVQGSGVSDSTTHSYVGSNLTERNAALSLGGPLAAVYVAQSKLGGSLTTTAGGLRTLSLNPAFAVNYDLGYDQGPATLPPAPLTSSGTGLAGGGTVPVSLVLDSGAANPAQVLVGQAGTVGDYCYFTSPVVAAATGRYFNVTLTFTGGAACTSRGLSGSVTGKLFTTTTSGKLVLVTTGSAFGFLED